MTMIYAFLTLLFFHALADYPLQGDFLARGKNPNTAIPGIPWYWVMSMHCVIHAGFVVIATRSVVLGCVEFIVHYLTDLAKCNNRINFVQDQMIHLLCKAIYVYLAFHFGALLP